MKKVVIVGAGQAGSSLAVKLRNEGYDGEITLIGAENFPPYQRPPLSKKYLLGEMDLERLYLRPEAFYQEHSITTMFGKNVTSVDVGKRMLLVEGEALSYDELVFTTGSDPRYLPPAIGGDLKGVFVVRNLNDIHQMTPYFEKGKRLLIVGGGYIGLEAAAVAAAKGLDVTLIEMSERILQRVASPQTSDYFRTLHETHGVRILESIGLTRLKGETDVTGAELSDGTHIDVDFVIAGIGITPSVAIAAEAGVIVENGIKTDEQGRSSAPNIWAAGDCASFPYKDNRIRLESVPNAIDQAEIVAQNIMGKNLSYIAKPWFWSDQYNVKLQIAGLNTGYDDVIERIGDKEGSISFWYYKGETLLAVDAMNEPRAYMIGKRLIEGGKSPSKEDVANQEFELKSLM